MVYGKWKNYVMYEIVFASYTRASSPLLSLYIVNFAEYLFFYIILYKILEMFIKINYNKSYYNMYLEGMFN